MKPRPLATVVAHISTAFCIGLLAGPVKGFAQPSPGVDTLVTTELVASSRTAEPGKPVTLALRFKLAPGWHIYWLNPGDSGMATAPRLKLPEGWTASDWQFPIPVKFDQPGGYVGYGYKDEVTLLVEVTPAASFTQGTATLGVHVDYLVCEAVCLPGDASLEVTLTSGVASPERKQDFDVWAARMPLGPTPVVRITTEGRGETISSAGFARREVEVRLPFGEAGYTRAEVFPLTPDGLEVRNVGAELREYGAVISMEAKLYAGQTAAPPSIRAIVVFSADSGRRVGYWVELPLG